MIRASGMEDDGRLFRELQLCTFTFDDRDDLVRFIDDKFLLRTAGPMYLDQIDDGGVTKSKVETRIVCGRVASA
jgi:hypothetical protein